MAASWPEIAACKAENRRELSLQGQEISKRIDKDGLDENIYALTDVNFLEISNTSLAELQSGLGRLVNLTSLLLCNNKLTAVPSEIGQLEKLKFLNLSNNAISTVPEELCGLPELHTLNLSMNKLQVFPSVEKMQNLHILNVSHNELEALPEGIFNADMVHLSQILASNNQIAELSADVSELPHLNILDISNNKLSEAPGELSICPRLKEMSLKGNKFKDRRLAKQVEQPGNKPGINYLTEMLKKEGQKSGKQDKKKGGKKKLKKKEEEEEVPKNCITVIHFPSETGVVVQVTQAVAAVRPFIVCCLVRNLDLQKTPQLFKNFISVQTKLHDTVCQNRQAATIATHDFKSVKLPLRYDAKFPQTLQIVPLSRHKEVSGEKLFEDLRKEAEDVRKQKKRNTFSGIHKYLDLLKDKTQYPCLVDSEGSVISFPPITNSDKTKISTGSKDILIEVTSSTNLDTCKTVMDEILIKMLHMGTGASSIDLVGAGGATGGAQGNADSDDEGVSFAMVATEKLLVEQVKVVDSEGSLKVLYPSRTDLQNEAIEVIRHFDS